jgi:hypothetical protein
MNEPFRLPINSSVVKQYHTGLLIREVQVRILMEEPISNQRKGKPRIIGLTAAVLKTVSPQRACRFESCPFRHFQGITILP